MNVPENEPHEADAIVVLPGEWKQHLPYPALGYITLTVVLEDKCSWDDVDHVLCLSY